MIFNCTYFKTKEVDTELFDEVTAIIGSYLADKKYGVDVTSIIAGIICVNPNFDNFFEPKRPQYTREIEYVKEGINFKFEKTLEISIKLDYNFFLSLDNQLKKKYLFEKILNTISGLLEEKKIVGLNIELDKLYSDLKKLFESEII